MTDESQESLLLERIRAGERSACEDCIRLHATGVYRFALRLTRNEAEAEDVVQDTFLNAFRGIHSFEGRASLRTWLFRIAYNAAMMRMRKRHPEVISIEEATDPAEGLPLPEAFFDWSSLPEAELEKAEVREEMERAISKLPSKLREVFVMRELEELSTEETARVLEITQETVKTRLHRARMWLRERLTSYFDPFSRTGLGRNPA
jgi:RNA polymerase sigma-70 factor, ECF subfamily